MTILWVLRKIQRAQKAKQSVERSEDGTKEQKEKRKANIEPEKSHDHLEKQRTKHSILQRDFVAVSIVAVAMTAAVEEGTIEAVTANAATGRWIQGYSDASRTDKELGEKGRGEAAEASLSVWISQMLILHLVWKDRLVVSIDVEKEAATHNYAPEIKETVREQ
ncbi:MAG: hypothetical protein Q9183_005651, partial [Haloplaca sp. 2 TL-2023]